MKSQKYSLVAEACLAVLSLRGLKALNVSIVAKRSKVSRGWIYKYIGANKEDLLSFSLKAFGEKLLQSDRIGKSLSPEEWQNYYLPELARTYELVKTHPWLPDVYYKYRYSSSSVGQVIKEIENQAHQDRTKELIKTWRLSQKEASCLASVLTAIRMGLAFHWVPCNDDDVKGQIEILNTLVGQFVRTAGK